MNELITSVTERHLHTYGVDDEGNGRTYMTLTTEGSQVVNHTHQIYKLDIEMSNGHEHKIEVYDEKTEQTKLEKENIQDIKMKEYIEKSSTLLEIEDRCEKKRLMKWIRIFSEWKKANPNMNPLTSKYLEIKAKQLLEEMEDEIERLKIEKGVTN